MVFAVAGAKIVRSDHLTKLIWAIILPDSYVSVKTALPERPSRVADPINFNADVNFLQEVLKNYDRPKNEDNEINDIS